jgi:hypothetical protein
MKESENRKKCNKNKQYPISKYLDYLFIFGPLEIEKKIIQNLLFLFENLFLS